MSSIYHVYVKSNRIVNTNQASAIIQSQCRIVASITLTLITPARFKIRLLCANNYESRIGLLVMRCDSWNWLANMWRECFSYISGEYFSKIRLQFIDYDSSLTAYWWYIKSLLTFFFFEKFVWINLRWSEKYILCFFIQTMGGIHTNLCKQY